jgi:hypothetical protein
MRFIIPCVVCGKDVLEHTDEETEQCCEALVIYAELESDPWG